MHLAESNLLLFYIDFYLTHKMITGHSKSKHLFSSSVLCIGFSFNLHIIFPPRIQYLSISWHYFELSQ